MTLAVFLLAVLLSLADGSGPTSTTSNNGPFHLVMVGVPEPMTDLDPSPAKGGYSSRHIKAIYKWDGPLMDKCKYKIKAEAIITVRVTPLTKRSRSFVKMYVDHKLLDIVEHEENLTFKDDLIKNGWFISKLTIGSCERFTLEYAMKRGGCRARLYEKQTIFTMKKKGEEEITFLQDWQWKATDEDECDDWNSSKFAEDYAQKHPPPSAIVL